MKPQERLPYSYWTGTQWVPQEIYVGPVMTQGWHIFNVALTLLTWGAWLPFYVLIYLSARVDKGHETERAQQAIQDYYDKVLPPMFVGGMEAAYRAGNEDL